MKLYGFWRSLATFRVRIALNLKGLSAEEPSINLLKGEQFADSYRRVNPQAMLPALDTGEGPALFQSLAIIEYLDETHPQPPLLPSGARARARVRGLALIAACEAHPLIVPRVRNYMASELNLDETARLKWIRHWIVEANGALESHLGEADTGRYCQGDQVTLADICVVSHAVGARLFDIDLAPWPRLRQITEDCLALDAFSKAHPLRQPGAPAHGH